MREVIVKFKAFQEMIMFFSQHSSNLIPKEKWVESMGFLFCTVEGDYYLIEDANGLVSGSELDVQMSPMKLSNIDQMVHEHEGDFIGGWWHTHPDLALFFSETDVQNQLFYQQHNEDGLGIVFDHTMIDEEFIGFKIFRLEHKFSTEYVEVPYQLQGFSKEGIRDTLEKLGIEDSIIAALADKYGGKGASLKIDFSKLGEPIVDDPLGDAEWILMEAEDMLKKEKYIDAIKKYKMASKILAETPHQKVYAKIMKDLIIQCIEHSFMDNAKEEFEIFKTLKGKLSEELYSELSSIIEGKFP